MSRRKILYERMTWPEIREAARADKVVLIPFGSIEQHGFHLPVDVDNRLAREVCVRAAERSDDAIVMAAMPFGLEGHHMDWPGTIDVDWDLLVRLGTCVTASLARHGFRRMIIVNGHGSNRPILDLIARLTVIRHPEVLCAGLSWFALEEVARVFREIGESLTSHACELETSAYLAIDPDAVDMAQAVRDTTMRTSPHVWSDLCGRRPDPAYKAPVQMMEIFSTSSISGVRGDPTKASAEKGERVLEAAAGELAEIVAELKARAILPPRDYHDMEVHELRAELARRSAEA